MQSMNHSADEENQSFHRLSKRLRVYRGRGFKKICSSLNGGFCVAEHQPHIFDSSVIGLQRDN